MIDYETVAELVRLRARLLHEATSYSGPPEQRERVVELKHNEAQGVLENLIDLWADKLTDVRPDVPFELCINTNPPYTMPERYLLQSFDPHNNKAVYVKAHVWTGSNLFSLLPLDFKEHITEQVNRPQTI